MLTTLLFILVIYWSVNLFFFIFPTFIWPKKKHKNKIFNAILDSNKIMRIAHRGGPRHNTENTIQGFTHIQKLTDCIEMDVCETADKILIVHHDHHLKRTCGVDKNVQEYNYADLPQFLAEIILDFGVKQVIKTKKQKIPTLEQVFKRFPDMILNIELKTPTETAMIQFVRLIHQYNRKQTTVIGIRGNQNFELKRKHPQIQTFTNDHKVYTLLVAYILGFVPFVKINEESFQIPVYSQQYEDWNVGRTVEKDKWKIKLYMKAIKALNFITRPLIWHLKRRGIVSLGWVCNTEEAFQYAIKSGFQGIMTDDPLLLNKYLQERNLITQH